MCTTYIVSRCIFSRYTYVYVNVNNMNIYTPSIYICLYVCIYILCIYTHVYVLSYMLVCSCYIFATILPRIFALSSLMAFLLGLASTSTSSRRKLETRPECWGLQRAICNRQSIAIGSRDHRPLSRYPVRHTTNYIDNWILFLFIYIYMFIYIYSYIYIYIYIYELSAL